MKKDEEYSKIKTSRKVNKEKDKIFRKTEQRGKQKDRKILR